MTHDGGDRRYYPSSSYSPIPPRALNGGLYAGEPFLPGAPWANVPATPTAEVLMREQLASARPPPGAQVLYPSGGTRPGNNHIERPGIRLYDPVSYADMACATAAALDRTTYPGRRCPNDDNATYSPSTGNPQKFAAFAYLT